MEVNNIFVARIVVKYNAKVELLFRHSLYNRRIPTACAHTSNVKKINVRNKHTVPTVSNLSFGEPENVKQILQRKIEYYDVNVVDNSKTKRFVGCEIDKHQQRLEFEEGVEATGIRK